MKLEIGYHHPFEVRKYSYPVPGSSGLKILYLSDLHYNRFGQRLAETLCEEIEKIHPDIILLGGDYTDSQMGLYYFQGMMDAISHFPNIFAICGNHDRPRVQQTRNVIEACNGTWLDKSAATITAGGLTIHIDGGAPATPSGTADLRILCLHRPIDVAKFAHHYQLIFAGHLHGGQAVLWSTNNGLYPGRLIYKWNRLSARLGNCQYLISKGLGDTLPIRYNCKKDAILVEVVASGQPTS